MVNNRVTSTDDPLIHATFLIKKSQKDFLDNLGKTGRSAFLRSLIDTQMNHDPHIIEKIKLEEENKQLEAKLNINKAQINEYIEESEKLKLTNKTREQLLNKAVERLLNYSQVINFNDRQFNQLFKTNIEDINHFLGKTTQPITQEEFQELIIVKATEKGKVVL